MIVQGLKQEKMSRTPIHRLVCIQIQQPDPFTSQIFLMEKYLY